MVESPNEIDELRAELQAQRAELEAQDQKLEAAMVQQEHRAIAIFRNLLRYWSYDKQDSRRKNAIQALLWWIFSPRTVATATISVVGIVGLILAWKANDLLDTQNEKLDAQNELVQTQNHLLTEQNKQVEMSLHLMQAERIAGLRSEWESLQDKIDAEITMWRRLHRGDTKADTLSASLTRRIIDLTKRFQPYRQLQEDGSLSPQAISHERGEILSTLGEIPVDNLNFIRLCDFRKAEAIAIFWREAPFELVDCSESILESCAFLDAEMGYSNFYKASLKHSILTGANLERASLASSDLQSIFLDKTELQFATLSHSKMQGASLEAAHAIHANFQASDLRDANFKHADLSHADFYQADLEGAQFDSVGLDWANLSSANLIGVDLSGARLDSAQIGVRWRDSLPIYGASPEAIEKVRWVEDHPFYPELVAPFHRSTIR